MIFCEIVNVENSVLEVLCVCAADTLLVLRRAGFWSLQCVVILLFSDQLLQSSITHGNRSDPALMPSGHIK